MVPPLPRNVACWPPAHLGAHSLSARAALITFPAAAPAAALASDGVPSVGPRPSRCHCRRSRLPWAGTLRVPTSTSHPRACHASIQRALEAAPVEQGIL